MKEEKNVDEHEAWMHRIRKLAEEWSQRDEKERKNKKTKKHLSSILASFGCTARGRRPRRAEGACLGLVVVEDGAKHAARIGHEIGHLPQGKLPVVLLDAHAEKAPHGFKILGRSK